MLTNVQDTCLAVNTTVQIQLAVSNAAVIQDIGLRETEGLVMVSIESVVFT